MKGSLMLLKDLPAKLRKYGLTVVEIDGWQNRAIPDVYGRPIDLIEVRGFMWHHTATPRSNYQYSDLPTLGTCLNGNSQTPGPLTQMMLGRTGIVYVLATGLCYHAGAGTMAGIPRDMANYYTAGIEMESSGIAPADWTEDQKRVAPYLGAALELEYLQHLPEELRAQVGHKEYSSTGKIDPFMWPGDVDGLRNAINAKIAEIRGGAKPAPVPTVPVPNIKPGHYVPDPHWLVEKGETLSQIAAWAKVTVPQLATFNGIKDPNKITVGERIWSPNAGTDTWMVEKGDTLGGISKVYASKYGHNVTVQQLQFANGINDPAKETKVGLRLLVP